MPWSPFWGPWPWAIQFPVGLFPSNPSLVLEQSPRVPGPRAVVANVTSSIFSHRGMSQGPTQPGLLVAEAQGATSWTTCTLPCPLLLRAEAGNSSIATEHWACEALGIHPELEDSPSKQHPRRPTGPPSRTPASDRQPCLSHQGGQEGRQPSGRWEEDPRLDTDCLKQTRWSRLDLCRAGGWPGPAALPGGGSGEAAASRRPGASEMPKERGRGKAPRHTSQRPERVRTRRTRPHMRTHVEHMEHAARCARGAHRARSTRSTQTVRMRCLHSRPAAL